MSSEVLAAVIAAGISFLTLIGTLIAQLYGFRITKKSTADTLAQQREDLDKSLKEQREALEKTLGEQRIRTLNERFATAADRLGDDKPSAVQLAGVYAMAGLADDWPENRQTCVDVLCAFLRLTSEAGPGKDAHVSERLAYSREIRQTVIRVIAAHLRPDHLRPAATQSWQRLNFDFTGAVFDGGDFSSAVLADGLSFEHAEFSGDVNFGRATFSDGCQVSFRAATFSDGCQVSFEAAKFSGGQVHLGGARFCGGQVSFDAAQFSGSTVLFTGAEFSGATVGFTGARFSRGTVSFRYAKFPRGIVGFSFAEFCGTMVDFTSAAFSPSRVTVDFSPSRDWSHPPEFSSDLSDLPPGVRLPDTIAGLPQPGHSVRALHGFHGQQAANQQARQARRERGPGYPPLKISS
jgi:uncharacterized protein YjbI with pentapeptide repeats